MARVILLDAGTSVSVNMATVLRNSSCTHVCSCMFSFCFDQIFSSKKMFPYFLDTRFVCVLLKHVKFITVWYFAVDHTIAVGQNIGIPPPRSFVRDIS
jgi:hypothetical protein